MRPTLWASVVILATATGLAWQPVAADGAHGVSPAVHGTAFAWAVATKPTTSSYTPDANHQYASIGAADVTITRSGEGSYTARMPIENAGVDPVSVHVTALGNAVVHCNPYDVTFNPGPPRNTVDVDVLCFDRAGNPVDSKFSINVMQPGSVVSGDVGFVQDPLQSSGTVTPTVSYNYRGFGNSVSRLSDPGQYEVVFTGITDALGGSVQITPVKTAATCSIDHWGTVTSAFSVASLHVFIQCRAPDGAETDAGFYLTFMSQTSLKGAAGGGQYYLLANQPAKKSYSPLAADQWSSTGDKANIKRSSAGVYTVTLRGMTSYGSAQVTPYGGRPSGSTLDRRCVVSSIASKSTPLASGGTAEKIGVRCYSSKGHLADSEFTLSYVK